MTINSMADLDANLGLPQRKVTKEQVRAALQTAMAVAETIREVCQEDPTGTGGCPAGPIYAALMAKGAKIEDYQAIVGMLERAGLIRSTNEFLFWIGEAK